MFNFKKIAKLGVATVAALSLVACGNDTNERSKENNKTGKTNLSLAIWDSAQEPTIREILDNFEEKNPDIKVDIEVTPYDQYWTKMEASATGGVMADIVWMNGPNFIEYASNDIIEPIDSYIKDVDLNKYPESIIDLYTYEGERYGIPKDWDTTALWYNKELFDKAGVEYPTDDWTWEEMEEAAEKINGIEDGVYGISANTEMQEGIYNIIPQNGGYVISEDMTKSGFDDPKTIEAIEKHVSWVEKGISPDASELAETLSRDMFLSGRLGMAHLGSWSVGVASESDIADSIDLVEMPPITEKAAVFHGLIYAMTSGSTHKDEAAEVINYLTSKEANDIWAEGGIVIPAHEDSLEIWLNSHAEYNLEAYTAALDYDVPLPISKNTPRWVDLQQQAMSEIYSLSVNPKERLEKLAKDMNEVLANE